MTHLRQLMIEELQCRNFAPGTIRAYVHGVEHFSQYFHRIRQTNCMVDNCRCVAAQAAGVSSAMR